MKPVNYLDQSLYTCIQTRNIMALKATEVKTVFEVTAERPKREIFEALTNIYGPYYMRTNYRRCCLFPKKEQLWTYTMPMVLKFPL